jgi:hypothetical protein
VLVFIFVSLDEGKGQRLQFSLPCFIKKQKHVNSNVAVTSMKTISCFLNEMSVGPVKFIFTALMN